MSPSDGLEALRLLLGNLITSAGVMDLRLRQWRQLYPRMASSPVLRELLEQEEESDTPIAAAEELRHEMGTASPEERKQLLEAFLKKRVAGVLRQQPAQLDIDSPLGSLGFDSLMALELRNSLESGLGVTLSATLIWSFPTIRELTRHLDEQIAASVSEARATGHAPGLPEPGPPAASRASESATTGSVPTDSGLVPSDLEDGSEVDEILLEVSQLSAEEIRRRLRTERKNGGSR
jgi:acyl carrier protein